MPSFSSLQSFGSTSEGSPSVVVTISSVVLECISVVDPSEGSVVGVEGVVVIEGVVVTEGVVGLLVVPGVVGNGRGSHRTESGVSQMCSQLLKSLSGWQ